MGRNLVANDKYAVKHTQRAHDETVNDGSGSLVLLGVYKGVCLCDTIQLLV